MLNGSARYADDDRYFGHDRGSNNINNDTNHNSSLSNSNNNNSTTSSRSVTWDAVALEMTVANAGIAQSAMPMRRVGVEPVP